MNNNLYIDSSNDSWCNRIRERLDEVQKMSYSVDFTCPIQVQMYNEAITAVLVTAPMLSYLELENKDV